MKKKKINKNENEWKGILQEKELFTIIENYDIPDRIKNELEEDKINTHFYQTRESNVTPDSFTVTSTNVNNEVVGEINLKDYKIKMESNGRLGYNEEDVKRIKILEWDNFTKDKTLSSEEKHYNIGVNKNWDDNKWIEILKNIDFDFKEDKVKSKRIDFEFTPLTFWQLFPSIAINLHSKEIELTWLCFGMYVKYKM